MDERLQVSNVKVKHEINLKYENACNENGQICRLCLETKAKFNIFQEDTKVTNKIMICCGLEVDETDGLPDHICAECADSLDSAINFRIQCQENDRYLRTNSTSWKINKKSQITIKEEDYDDYEGDNSLGEYNNIHEILKIDFDPPKEEKKTLKKLREKVKTKAQTKTKAPAKTKEHPVKVKPEKKLQIKYESAKTKMRHNSSLCTVCGKCFFTRKKYEMHLRSHGDPMFTCNECDKSFKERGRLQEHMITHFGVKNIPCDECGKCFTTRGYVMKHVKKVHREKTKVQCNICSKMLCDRQSLRKHIQGHTGEKNYECNYCDRRFTNKMSLNYHTRTHTGERPYACHHCDKRFSDGKSRSDHEMLHTGETPYSCPICAKAFAQLCNMKSHFKYNHKGLNIKDYQYFKRRNKDLLNETAVNMSSVPQSNSKVE